MTAKIIHLPRRGHGPGCVLLASPEDLARVGKPITPADEALMLEVLAAMSAPAKKPWWQIWRRA
ncbi:MAG: hypothetical protein WAO08_06020 [Hyphomicrobiaceae bacterium]